MREWACRIDEIILGYFTTFSHKFQERTGKTNFFLAKIFVFITSFSTIITVANYFKQLLVFPTTLDAAVLFFVTNASLIRNALICDRAEAQIKDGKIPPLIMGLLHLRIFRITMLIICLIYTPHAVYAIQKSNVPILEIFRSMFPFTALCASYCMLVTPLPPGFARKWFGKYVLAPTK